MASAPRSSGERVFDLPVHRSSRWVFNCYVIEGDGDQSLIVDPGLPSTARAALTHLRALGRLDTQVTSLCTHGHVDHLSGMPLLRQQCQARSYLPARCQQYLEGETPRTFDARVGLRFFPMLRQQPIALGALGELATAGRNIGFAGMSKDFLFPYPPDGFIGEGARLPGASEWDVIATPGHSDDSLCFYHRSSATLLSGDAVLTHDGRAWFNPEWLDGQASHATEERLRALDVQHLLPGHGLPISGHVWDRALSFRERPPAKGLFSRCMRRITG